MFFLCRPLFIGEELLAVEMMVSPEATEFALFCSSCLLAGDGMFDLPFELGAACLSFFTAEPTR